MKKIIIFIAVLIALLLFYKTLFPPPAQKLVGKMAPAFSVKSETGEGFELETVLGKKVILLNFWATWCAPCRDEIPILNEISQILPEENFSLISLMEDDLATDLLRHQSLKNFEKKIPINFAVHFDADGRVADSYGAYLIPASYIIDANGKIISVHEGPVTKWDKSAILKLLQELIQE